MILLSVNLGTLLGINTFMSPTCIIITRFLFPFTPFKPLRSCRPKIGITVCPNQAGQVLEVSFTTAPQCYKQVLLPHAWPACVDVLRFSTPT